MASEISTNKIKDKYNFDFDLKEDQIKIIDFALKKENTVGIFPTGFGKSICFQILPLAFEHLKAKKCTAFIFSPLKSLMFDQCSSTNARGIKSCAITNRHDMSQETNEGIKNGQYTLVYMSPEILLNTKFWHDVLIESPVYQDQLCAVVIDEFHLLETWGELFRPTFRRLGEIRSHFPDIPFMLLSATCTETILQNVLKNLYITKPAIVSCSPDRKNIFLEYKSVPSMDPLNELEWYIKLIEEKGADTEKAIIYVRSVNVLSVLYRDIMGRLRSKGYKDGVKLFDNRLIGCFHAGLEDKDQKHVTKQFAKTNSVLRLILCTVAFGLGVNIPDIRYVIHWGACNSVLQYWQEVGRAGRDNLPATAYYYATRPSIVHANDDMKSLCVNLNSGKSMCLRKEILTHMIGHKETEMYKCNHGNKNCESCKCSKCLCCTTCKASCVCVK